MDYLKIIPILGAILAEKELKYVMDMKLQDLKRKQAIIIKYLCDNKLLFPFF